ncbi:MAG: DnaJ domain-containing protein [Desulfobacteraceae bacterium]|nr:DnaJ domain-containing protein [Desulfobacteraceae bacterium]
MNQKEHNKYYEILELSPDASLQEIKNAYKRLKKKYSAESSKKDELKQIEDAYSNLSASFDKDKQKEKTKTVHQESQKSKPRVKVFSGYRLKEIREEQNIRLEDIAQTTKIQLLTLKHIEAETYEKLPPEVYIKGFVASYAKYLSLDSKKVAAEYLVRYSAWKREQEKKQKRHFGIKN